MKKFTAMSLSLILLIALFAGCGQPAAPGEQESEATPTDPGANNSQPIIVISREDGSGTRGAFVELFGILERGSDGTSKDNTTREATIANQTDVMMTSVSGNPNAIGYISLGSLNNSVTALEIDGAAATKANVQNGTYKISRPFIIATNGEAEGLTKDFIDFILSKEGQEVVSANYIPVDDNAPAYEGDKPEGRITVAGSSSVNPAMEKLVEAYALINPGAVIEIQMSDSSAGMIGAMDGSCDIGMSSRDLRDSEKEQLIDIPIALDGIAVIVNNNNSVKSLSKDQVKGIYTGEMTVWSEVAR